MAEMTDNTPGVEAFKELVSDYEESIADLHRWKEGMSVPYREFFDKRHAAYESLIASYAALVESRDAAIKAHDDVVAEFVRGRHAFETVMRERDAAIKERDIVWRNYKELVYDFMPETECLPGSKCDSYGHDDDCPVVNAQASVHNLRVKCDAMAAQNAELREVAQDPEVWVLSDGDYYGCRFCQNKMVYQRANFEHSTDCVIAHLGAQ